MENKNENFHPEERILFASQSESDKEPVEQIKKSTELIEHTAELAKKQLIEGIVDEPEKLKLNLQDSKIVMLKKLADKMQEIAKQMSELLVTQAPIQQEIKLNLSQVMDFSSDHKPELNIDSNQIMEGVFTGEKMIAENGKEYNVPVNYASKSKLVEGDTLKLIITERGTFVYKQIKPIERIRIVGNLEQGPTGEYYVSANNRRWRVLNASVTYFKGEIGDEVIILTPREGQSKWAAVENIVKKY